VTRASGATHVAHVRADARVDARADVLPNARANARADVLLNVRFDSDARDRASFYSRRMLTQTAALGANPPTKIQTDRLVLRPWGRTDAPALTALQHESLASLRPFMPWSQHRYSVPEMIERIDTWREQWQRGHHFLYGVRLDGRPIGEVGLHKGDDPYAPPSHISYWVGSAYEGQGYASEAVRGLYQAADALFLTELAITCETRNDRSARLAQRLGFVLTETADGLLTFRRQPPFCAP
jgi:RimJ/RimL family protein N-acetyltransferase